MCYYCKMGNINISTTPRADRGFYGLQGGKNGIMLRPGKNCTPVEALPSTPFKYVTYQET